MKKITKRFLGILMSLVLILGVFYMYPTTANATSISTRKELQTAAKKAKSNWDKYSKLDNKQRKGTINLQGTLVESSPMIIKVGLNYYLVKGNTSYVKSTLLGTYGAGVSTGSTITSNGYSCTVVNAKKINFSYGTKATKYMLQYTNYSAGLTNKFNIYSSTSSIAVKGTLNLKNVGKWTESDCTFKKTTWKSSNTAVATVNANGVVTGKTSGKAVITCTSVYSNKTDKITITVANLKNISCVNADNMTYYQYDSEYPSFKLPEGCTYMTGINFTCSENKTLYNQFGNDGVYIKYTPDESSLSSIDSDGGLGVSEVYTKSNGSVMYTFNNNPYVNLTSYNHSDSLSGTYYFKFSNGETFTIHVTLGNIYDLTSQSNGSTPIVEDPIDDDEEDW